MKTREEVNELKHDWANDPIYEITEIEGFGEYRDELIDFKVLKEAQWKLEAEKREKRSSEFNIDEAVNLTSWGAFNEGNLSIDDPIFSQRIYQRAIAHALIAIATELREIRVNGLSIEDIHREY